MIRFMFLDTTLSQRRTGCEQAQQLHRLERITVSTSSESGRNGKKKSNSECGLKVELTRLADALGVDHKEKSSQRGILGLGLRRPGEGWDPILCEKTEEG